MIRALPLVAALLVGCVTNPRTDGDLPDATTPAKTTCVPCLQTSCLAEVATCTHEPTCGAYLDCLSRCSDVAGVVAPSCAAACGGSLDAAGQRARAILDVCAATSSCGACGIEADAGARSPVLTQTCPPVDEVDPDPCRLCQKRRCCETRDAVLAEPDFKAWQACIAACSTNAVCAAACDVTHAKGFALAANHIACFNVLCLDTCLLGDPPEPCTACYYTRCADVAVACQSDPECARLETCAAKIDTREACEPRFSAAAVKKLRDGLLCRGQRCSAECL